MGSNDDFLITKRAVLEAALNQCVKFFFRITDIEKHASLMEIFKAKWHNYNLYYTTVISLCLTD